MYWASAGDFRVDSKLRLFALVATVFTIAPSFADPTDAPEDAMVAWPTPEGRAFEAARQEAGVAYINCVLTVHRANTSATQTDAKSACSDQAAAYRAYLPADEAETILDVVAAQVHSEFRNQ